MTHWMTIQPTLILPRKADPTWLALAMNPMAGKHNQAISSNNNNKALHQHWCLQQQLTQLLWCGKSWNIYPMSLFYSILLYMHVDSLNVTISTTTLCYTLNELSVSCDWYSIPQNEYMIETWRLCEIKTVYLSQVCHLSTCCHFHIFFLLHS